MDEKLSIDYLPEYLWILGIISPEDSDYVIETLHTFLNNECFGEESYSCIINICFRLILIHLQNSDDNCTKNVWVKLQPESIFQNIDIDFKVELINSWLVYNNYPLLISNEDIKELTASPLALLSVFCAIVEIVNLFDEGFWYFTAGEGESGESNVHGKTISILGWDLETTDGNVLLEANKSIIKDQLSKDMTNIRKLTNCPPALQKRISIEVEKYKTLQQRKIKICK